MSTLENEIELLDNKIAFQFLENISNKSFKSTTKSGIILAESPESQVGKARWGQVLMVGPDVSEVRNSEYILIEPLSWTTGLELDSHDEEFWMTTEDRILAVSEEYPDSP